MNSPASLAAAPSRRPQQDIADGRHIGRDEELGCRKPDREIYDLTLERMGGPSPEECLFIDDTDVNCTTATELGMSAVHFRDNDQALPELRGALAL